jgi:hypothetical protein
MVGMLQALRHTALHHRLKAEGRLYENTTSGDNLSVPNFRTTLPRSVLVKGYCDLLQSLYSPEAYFTRTLRSLEIWKTRKPQVPAKLGWDLKIKGFFGGLWHLGVKSHYKWPFWKTLATIVTRHWREPVKIVHGFSILLAGRHMVNYTEFLTARYRQLDPALLEDPVPVTSAVS